MDFQQILSAEIIIFRKGPEEIDNEELNALLTTIKNQGDEIAMKEKEILRLQNKLEKVEASVEKKKAATKKPATKTKKS